MKLATKVLVGAFVVAGGALLGRWQAARRFVEEPRYTVVRTLGDSIELRRYEPMVVAETRVRASFDAASNEGFRRLAAYIFGGNQRRESLAMTAPVAVESERLAMTAPVAVESESGEQIVRFVMPPGRASSTLPMPDDARVTLREVPAQTVAVLTYSGTTTPAILETRTQALRDALAREGLTTTGNAVSSRYDPPSTLPMLRRNEIWIPIAD
ncbi:MAG: heme-binding protein [Deltaproteobacteria bacterium]|nr:heme-binding protein [Deltaproteobacteria bacterium]